jgi:dynein heavy chain
MMDRVPDHLVLAGGMSEQIEGLRSEVMGMYDKSIRKSMIQYALKKPKVPGVDDDEDLPEEPEGLDFSSPWRETYNAAREQIRKNLHILHPSHQSILSICQNDYYSKLLLVDCSETRSQGPIECEHMRNDITLACDKAEEKLMHSWYPEIVNIFVNKAAFSHMRDEQLDSFYSSVQMLISNQLKDIIIRTLKHYVQLFNGENEQILPCFKMELILDDEEQIQFYPGLDDLENVIIDGAKTILKTLQNVPTVQSWLGGGATTVNADAKVDTVVVNENLSFLNKRVLEYLEAGIKQKESLEDKYNMLVNGESEKFVNDFLASEHNFEEYTHEIERFRELKREISSLSTMYYFPIMRLDCDDLKRGLSAKANGFAERLLTRLADDHRNENERIVSSFVEMKERALTTPQNTEEVVIHMKYIETAQNTTLVELNKNIKENQGRMSYLLEYYALPMADITLNSSVLNWPTQMSPVFDESDQIIAKAQKAGEDELKEKREKVILELEKLKQRVKEFVEFGDMDMMMQYLKDVQAVQRKCTEFTELIERINIEEDLFKWEPTEYPDVEFILTAVEPYHKLFSSVVKWQRSEKKWMDGNFLELDAEGIEAEVDEFGREVYKLVKQFNTLARKELATDEKDQKPSRNKKKEAETEENFEEKFPPLKVATTIKAQIHDFKENVPIISTLCNPGMRSRHWDQMGEKLGYSITPDSGTSLRKMLRHDLLPFMEELETISGSASKEYSLEKAMQRMVEDWDEILFQTTQYRDTGISILAAVDEIQTVLDDQIVKTQTMRGSPFIKPFDAEIKAWEARLLKMQETLDEWLKVQSQWLYLEPIFSSEDINQQMPEEGKKFSTVDRNWKDIMKYLNKDPKVLAATGMPGLYEKLIDSNNLLDEINKGLNAYLEKKRLFFGRFFFLSNDEMLEILSETKDPTRVQPHLKKCFEGIAKLTFTPTLDITHMLSSEGEQILLSNTISTSDARGAVEKWLLQVQDTMLVSLRDIIEKSVAAYSITERKEWVREWPGQVAICVGQTYWTIGVHNAIQAGPGGLQEYYKVLQKDLEEIVALVRGKLNKQNRITLGALVTIDVHARDVVQELIDANVEAENAFEWLSQLRYYWERDNMYVRIINATVDYAYEYLGNSGRLVITPLTDRCYRTLVGAFYLNLNGAPEGPAGTGKTETTKDLAKALAIQCVVFNCSDGLDFIQMGKFFKGLAACGAWACFDEFNRIELEVLSVVAQQILCIQRAVAAKQTEFTFEGTKLDLNPNCYVCITMNPGYGNYLIT